MPSLIKYCNQITIQAHLLVRAILCYYIIIETNKEIIINKIFKIRTFKLYIVNLVHLNENFVNKIAR